jgi:competence protein ComEC
MRLVYIALGWIAGIVLAANSNAQGLSLAWLMLVVLSIAAAWLIKHWWAVALVALALGGLRMSLVPTSSEVARYNNSGGLTVEGLVVAEPDARDDRVLLRVDVQTITQAGQTVLTDEAPVHSSAQYGDRVSATGLLVTPAEGDTFSYADFLARGSVFSVMPGAAVTVMPDGWQGNTLYAGLLNLKAQIQNHIAQYLPEPEAGLLTGILLGNERGIAPEVSDAFDAVGAAHVIAISGFNMTILSGVVVGTLTRLGVRARWAALLGIAIIAVYTLFVGASAAVVRAAIMSSMLVIGTAIRRKTFVPASLAFVTLLVSLQNPTVLWDVGFQLSVFAVLGLSLFTDPLSNRLNRFLGRRAYRRSLIGDLLFEPLIVTLAVQITTLPLVVLYFGRLSLVTIAVNLLIVPVQAAILILGIIASIVAFVLPPFAQILYWVTWILLSWTINVVRLFAELPFAQVDFQVDPRLIAIFFTVLIGGAMIQATQPTWALRLAQRIRQRALLGATAFGGLSIAILMGAVGCSIWVITTRYWLKRRAERIFWWMEGVSPHVCSLPSESGCPSPTALLMY